MVNNFEFDADQKQEIDAGIKAGLDVSCYAKKDFMAIQMHQIRLGLEESLDVRVYAKPEFDWFQMEEIRKGMQTGIDYNRYSDPSIAYDKMRQIRKGLEEGIDLSDYKEMDAGILRQLRKAAVAKVSIIDYINEGYVEEQLEEICSALKKGLFIDPYLNKEFRGIAIREICLSLEEGIEPSIYASIEYDWKQMREIRLGLEHRVDVTLYLNSLFSWKQMQEIRLGLEDGLDVTPYRSFVYVAADMRKIREQLIAGTLETILKADTGRGDVTAERTEQRIAVFVSNDEMEAYIEVRCEQDISVNRDEIMEVLHSYGIRHGILEENISKIIQEKKYNRTVMVAKGNPPVKGSDGWYEYFFQTEIDRSPTILPDGSADYTNVKWFEQVERGQKIALYHAAKFGTAGYTVTGKLLPPQRGNEKSILTGKGFQCLSDGMTYVSCLAGKIELVAENRIEITRLCVLNEVSLATGNVNFDGSILVKGDVGRGAVICATEDVVVNGFVEAAEIHCKGDVFLRRGIDGAEIGIIEAGKKVISNFLEYARIVAGVNIEANYCLNCNLTAGEWILIHGEKGTLAGGIAVAGKGVRAYNVGNHVKLPTVLKLGVNDEMLRNRHDTELKIREVSRQLAILGNAYRDFQRKYLPEVRNTMEIYLKTEKAIYTKELEMEYLHKELQKFEQEIENMVGAKAVVSGILYEGTTIYIDHLKMSAHDIRAVTLRRINDKIVMQPN